MGLLLYLSCTACWDVLEELGLGGSRVSTQQRVDVSTHLVFPTCRRSSEWSLWTEEEEEGGQTDPGSHLRGFYLDFWALLQTVTEPGLS